MLEPLFNFMEKYADHKHSKRALAIVAFAESSFFPIPPFVLIIGMLAHEKKPSWLKLAAIGTISSVLGGVFAYILGKFFYGYVGEPLVQFYGIENQIQVLGTHFREHVFATILLASLSPIPYKVFTLSAGLFSVNIWAFIVASLIGRSFRFLAVSYIAMRYGSRAKDIILKQQKYILRFFVFVFIALVVYYVLKIQGIL